MYIRINRRVWIWIFLLLPIYKVGYTAVSPTLEMVYDLARAVTLLATMLFFARNKGAALKNPELDMAFFIKIWILLQTLLLGVRNNDALYSCVLVIAQGILFNYMLRKDNISALKAFLGTFEIIVTLNLLSIILFPAGMYNVGGERIYTLIGHANTTILYVLPMAALSWIAYREWRGTARWVFDNIVGALSVILIGSATGAVLYAVFLLLMLVTQDERIRKLSVWLFFCLFFLISVSIILFHVQEILSGFVEIVLKRSLDFTGRTFYWNRHLEMIAQRPFLGHGAAPGEQRYGGLAAHNFFLEVLFEGGFVLLFFVAIFYYKLSVKLMRYRHLKSARVLCAAIISLMLSYITEGQISNFISWTPLLLATNVHLLDFAYPKSEKEDT